MNLTSRIIVNHICRQLNSIQSATEEERHMRPRPNMFDIHRLIAHRDQHAIVRFVLACLAMRAIEIDRDAEL